MFFIKKHGEWNVAELIRRFETPKEKQKEENSKEKIRNKRNKKIFQNKNKKIENNWKNNKIKKDDTFLHIFISNTNCLFSIL